MKINLSFWRFVIVLYIAKSFLWKHHDETYYFHIGSFSAGDVSAYKIVILPFCLSFGFIKS